METDKTGRLEVPPALMAEIQTAAEEEHRSTGDLIRDAVEQYLENRRWQRLLAYGEEQARKLGLTEADVPGLIAESRRENAERGH